MTFLIGLNVTAPAADAVTVAGQNTTITVSK